MHGFVFIEIPVVTAAMFTLAGFLIRRHLVKQDETSKHIQETLDEHTSTLATQTTALAILVDNAPRTEKRLSVVEERITGLRETVAQIQARLP